MTEENETKSLFTTITDENWLQFLLNPLDPIASGTLGATYLVDEGDLANQFAMAASTLVDMGLKGSPPVWMYATPILFLYRHALELFLKGIVENPKPNHRLEELLSLLSEKVKLDYGVDLEGTWVADTIKEFVKIDPNSTSFRYVNSIAGQRLLGREYEVDFRDLKERLYRLFLLLQPLHMAAKKGRLEVREHEEASG